jgi:hypothetical protein
LFPVSEARRDNVQDPIDLSQASTAGDLDRVVFAIEIVDWCCAFATAKLLVTAVLRYRPQPRLEPAISRPLSMSPK